MKSWLSTITLILAATCSAPVAGQAPTPAAGDRFLVLDMSTSKPGTYAILVTVTQDGTVTWKRPTVITVGDGGGGAPQPPTDPNPPQPPKLTGLAAKAAEWVRGSVNHEGWQAEAERLAAGYESVAGMIESGAIADALDIAPAQLQANLQAIGEAARSKWKSPLEQFSIYLRAELQAGRIKQVKDHAALWRQFAAGLRGAAK